MSTSRRCKIWKATDGQWYLLLGRFEGAHEAADCDVFGPFGSESAAFNALDQHSNPGAYYFDASGTAPPPANPVRHRPRYW